MNTQQRRKLLANRVCHCDSIEHACETIREFEARTGVTILKKTEDDAKWFRSLLYRG